MKKDDTKEPEYKGSPCIICCSCGVLLMPNQVICDEFKMTCEICGGDI